MNTLYLICGSDNVNQEKLAFLLNSSPDLCGEQSLDKCDEYASLEDRDFEWYNPEIRESKDISRQQLDDLLNLIENRSFAVVLNTENFWEVFDWSRGTHAILINAVPDNVNYGHEVDRIIEQRYWQTEENIYQLWEQAGVASPSKQWIQAYLLNC